ncbi:MAG: SDR family oxidoreductase [Alphaproteobacteria bacterium]|nr:SDR family oxidoreductase [Alphaproteobacteria bacterium]
MKTSKGYALVTGSAKRIGRAIALDLANDGWNIVIHHYRSVKEARALAEEIENIGRKAICAPCDLENATEVKNYIDEIIRVAENLRVIVNSASMFESDALDPDETRHKLINVEAPRILSTRFAEKCSGNIVNILDGTPVAPNFTSYGKSKLALTEMTIEMAKAFAPRVRVNGLAPGPTLIHHRQSSKHFEDMVSRTSMKTAIPVEMITSAVRFLLENTAVTGQIIYVDNGYHLDIPRTRT